MKLNGQQLVKDTCLNLNINFAQLIAATTIWAHPDCVKELRRLHDNPNALWKFNIRRKKPNELRRQTSQTDGCFLDDNTEANKAIKTATNNIAEQGTFNVCHIYEGSCYDKDFHLAIPNLILVPKEIASLTDFDQNVMAALKYRSYELYNFYYKAVPVKPAGYDDLTWRSPVPFSWEISKSISARKELYYGVEIL